MSVESFEAEDHLVFSANTDEGDILDADQAQRLFSLPGECRNAGIVIPCRKQLDDFRENEKIRITDTISAKNSIFFDEEMEKMEKWADDLKNGLETELKELDREIKFLKSEAKKILKLDEKLKAQKSIKEMEKRRSSKRRLLFDAQDEIDRRKETLIEDVEQRLKQQIRAVELFAIKWKLV